VLPILIARALENGPGTAAQYELDSKAAPKKDSLRSVGAELSTQPVLSVAATPDLSTNLASNGQGTPLPAKPQLTLGVNALVPSSEIHQKVRILVVDDSLAVRAHLRSLLERQNFAVDDAHHVPEAMRLMGREDYHLILMDILMPEVDGYEGCRQIKAKYGRDGRLPIVMLTSKSSPFDRIRGKMAGCDAYLTKPVDQNLLYEVVEMQLRVAKGRA
jgi:CheY-like chemotaxis protein